MEPWSYELAGRLEEHAVESEVLKGNPLGDPHVRPLWVYVPPGYDDDADRRYPSDLRDPGPDRPARHVAQPLPVPAQLPGARRRAVRERRVAAPRLVVFVDALDVARREPVHRLAGHRALPHVHLRRARALRRRALPDAGGRRAPRDRRQVERRLRRDGRRDAAARRLRRPRHARRRRALRDVLPARLPQVGARAARQLRRLVRSLLGGLPQPSGPVQGDRRQPPERLVHGRLLLGRRGRHRADALRHRRRASCGRRSGSAGSPGTRCGWCRSTPTRSAR